MKWENESCSFPSNFIYVLNNLLPKHNSHHCRVTALRTVVMADGMYACIYYGWEIWVEIVEEDGANSWENSNHTRDMKTGNQSWLKSSYTDIMLAHCARIEWSGELVGGKPRNEVS